jgi:hypothetical protein
MWESILVFAGIFIRADAASENFVGTAAIGGPAAKRRKIGSLCLLLSAPRVLRDSLHALQ